MDHREAWMLTALAVATVAHASQAPPATLLHEPTAEKYYSLPAAWAGEWDGTGWISPDEQLPEDLKIEPPNEKTDAMIISHLQPSGLAKMKATPYDNSPGSLCDPEGWFPFINYGYGFALLDSPGKITMVPVEPETEGIRRVYLKAKHAENLTPTWNGDSIAHWDGDTLVVDTIGYNDLSWLGDDREPHTTALHMVERMRLVHDGKYLQVETIISDPGTLTSPYKLTRYFEKFNATHVGAGPGRDSAELVCNEDVSPFNEDGKKAASPAKPKK